MNFKLIKHVPASVWTCWKLKVKWSWGLWFFGSPCIRKHPGGRIVFRGGAKVISSARYNEIGVIQKTMLSVEEEGAVIEIGNEVGMSGVSLSARERITIGDYVKLGSGVMIMDNDAHPLELAARHANDRPKVQPVVLEDHCFIGARSIILKGVQIGRGAVVGAGSVVTKAVAPFTIVAGNPAKKIGEINQNED